MAVIPVSLAGRSYEVRVDGGLLGDLPAQCGNLLRKKRVPKGTSEYQAHWILDSDEVRRIVRGERPVLRGAKCVSVGRGRGEWGGV